MITRKEVNIKNFSLIKVIIIIVIAATVLVLLFNSPTLTQNAANILANNAFYIPEDKNISFSVNMLLREACFGGEYYDYDEKTFIIYENIDSPKVNIANLADMPETSPEISGPEENTEGMLPIIPCDLSVEDVLTLNNTTKKRPDTSRLLLSRYDFGYNANSDKPLVLIIHTHATECYSRENSTYYDPNGSTRSTDESINMIAVGKTLADTLNSFGINTLHCTTQHDAASYSNSYSAAAASIKEYLEKYPSIRYVFDVHRDAVMYDSGAKARAVSEIEGQEVAQIMLLAGTDAGGADFPDWEANLTLALKLADKISGDYPDLMRPIALRGASYNEQYTKGSLLIEIGTDGNTLSQAKNAARILGKYISDLIKDE